MTKFSLLMKVVDKVHIPRNHDLIIIIFIWSLISYEILMLNLAHYYHYNSLQIIE